MSKLTIRRYDAKADGAKLTTFTAANRPNALDLQTKDWYAFVCQENGVDVGISTGRATGGDTAILYIVHSALSNRKDIIYALLERQAQNGLDTGHTYAEASIPNSGNCTAMGATATLTALLDKELGLKWDTRGVDTVTNLPGEFVTHPELKALVEKLKAVLDAMKCERVWA